MSIPCVYLCFPCLILGFEPDVGKFFFFMLTVPLLASTATSLAFAISARAPVTTVAIVGTAVSYIIQLVYA